MHLWISGGGTAGHVYPAVAVLDALAGRVDRVTWIGRTTGLEADLMSARGVAYRGVDAGPLLGRGPLGVVSNLLRLGRGALQALRDIRADRPDAVLVTGGYVSVPAALAARAARVPLAVLLPDARPGRAVRVIARLADRIIATVPEAVDRIPAPRSRIDVTGYPVRGAVREMDAERGRAILELDADLPILLAWGGSQGARRINRAVTEVAPELLTDWQIVHVTGPADEARVWRAHDSLDAARRARWKVAPYLDDERMAAALQAADVTVCRSGASVLGELPAAGLPAILVPLPIAGGHQRDNADVLADAGAAVIVDDGALSGAALRHELSRMVEEPQLLDRMSSAARSLDRPGAANRIADVVLRMARPPADDAR